MKAMFLVLSMGSAFAAVPPLQVVGVIRLGMPPYEGAERLYRLEGDGCQSLRVDEYVTLRRSGGNLRLGRLQVTALKDGYALARLAAPGETYPLKGDLAVPHERAGRLPDMPPLQFGPLRPAGDLAPSTPSALVPASPRKEVVRWEPVYFLMGNAELSPAALRKLEAWAQIWGKDGRWVLRVPGDAPASLSEHRVNALKETLTRLGVSAIDVRRPSELPPSRYEAILVGKEAW